MINREIIRNKVVQLVYAYYQDGGKAIATAEKELMFSLNKAYELYLFELSLIPAIRKEAQRRYEIERQMARRMWKEAPSDRFVNNVFALQVEENKTLTEYTTQRKEEWVGEPELVAKLFGLIADTDIYKEYIEEDGHDYNEDRELWRKLYRLVIENNEDIDTILEENSIYWNDDKTVVDTFILKTIKRFDPANGADQQLLPDFDSEDDKAFARKLFRSAINNSEEYQKIMGDMSQNWDFDRLAYMDIVIMQIAIAEMMTFPSIPIRVTINEFVEIAKCYSTPQSWRYVNGMLDAIARHLIETGQLLKTI